MFWRPHLVLIRNDNITAGKLKKEVYDMGFMWIHVLLSLTVGAKMTVNLRADKKTSNQN